MRTRRGEHDHLSCAPGISARTLDLPPPARLSPWFHRRPQQWRTPPVRDVPRHASGDKTGVPPRYIPGLASSSPATRATGLHSPCSEATILTFTCPVCGYDCLTLKPYENWPPPPGVILTPPYEDLLGRSSYDVCPSCGFEFGNDDNPGTTEPSSFEPCREDWIARGRAWFSPRRPGATNRFPK
jgi:hypothetical protein